MAAKEFTGNILFAGRVCRIEAAKKRGIVALNHAVIYERLKATNNRRRAYGWVRGVFPQIKRPLLLAFFLIILIIIAVRFLPFHFDETSDRARLQIPADLADWEIPLLHSFAHRRFFPVTDLLNILDVMSCLLVLDFKYVILLLIPICMPRWGRTKTT